MKTLHKTLAAIFALLAVMFLAACSSEVDDDTDTITADTLAGTTWTCTYTSVDADGGEMPVTTTFVFTSSTEVTMTDYFVDTGVEETESGTYSVSGSRVTLTFDKSGTGDLIYSSGKLVFVGVYKMTGSSGLGSAITADDLKGTTWVCSGSFIYNGTIYTTTDTFEFGDGGKVTMIFESDYYEDDIDEGTYSVSGTTVTIHYTGENGKTLTAEFTYFSPDELIYYYTDMTFTKG